MALGKPVLATDSGGPRDTIKNGFNGYICKNYEELIMNFSKIINDYDKFNPQEISDYCKNNFSENKVYQMLNDLFSKRTKIE